MILFARHGGVSFSNLQGSGVWFLLKPAGYWRDRRSIFFNGTGFKPDIGGVFQLLET
jgi:hypothetical protein